MLSATLCDFNRFFRKRTPVFVCTKWYCSSDFLIIAINFVRLTFCQLPVYLMVVIKGCWMLQSLVTHVVIFFHMSSQTSPLSAYELSLMFSCRAPPRRLCPLGNLLVSMGGLLLGPPKALSSPPTSPVPQALLALRPPQQSCPQPGIQGHPRAGTECVPGAGLCIWPCWASGGCCQPLLQPTHAPLESGFDHRRLGYIRFSDWISVDLLPVSTLGQFLNSNLLASLLIVCFSIQIKLSFPFTLLFFFSFFSPSAFI